LEGSALAQNKLPFGTPVPISSNDLEAERGLKTSDKLHYGSTLSLDYNSSRESAFITVHHHFSIDEKENSKYYLGPNYYIQQLYQDLFSFTQLDAVNDQIEALFLSNTTKKYAHNLDEKKKFLTELKTQSAQFIKELKVK